jgi:hypothetical protein
MAVCPATGALLYPESDIKVSSLIGIPSFRDRWGGITKTFSNRKNQQCTLVQYLRQMFFF